MAWNHRYLRFRDSAEVFRRKWCPGIIVRSGTLHIEGLDTVDIEFGQEIGKRALGGSIRGCGFQLAIKVVPSPTVRSIRPSAVTNGSLNAAGSKGDWESSSPDR